jgi:hypothetical protein
MKEFYIEEAEESNFDDFWKQIQNLESNERGIFIHKFVSKLETENLKKLLKISKFQKIFESLMDEASIIYTLKLIIQEKEFVEKYLKQLQWRKITNESHLIYLLCFFIGHFQIETLNLDDEMMNKIINHLINLKSDLNEIELESKKCTNHHHHWIDQNGDILNDVFNSKIEDIIQEKEEITFPKIKKFKKKNLTIIQLQEMINSQIFQIHRNLNIVPLHTHKINNEALESILIDKPTQVVDPISFEPCEFIYQLDKYIKELKRIVMNRIPPLHVHKLSDDQKNVSHFKVLSEEEKFAVGQLFMIESELVMDSRGKECHRFEKIFSPQSLEECQQILKENKLVSIGGLLSFPVKDRFMKDSVFINTKGLNKIIGVEDDCLIVQSGVETNEILKFLNEKNLSLLGLHPFENHTIGGLIFMNYQGFNHESIQNSIKSMKLISEGELIELNQEDGFSNLQGLIVEVKLKLIPNDCFKKKFLTKNGTETFQSSSIHFCKKIENGNKIVLFEKVEDPIPSKDEYFIDEIWLENEDIISMNQLFCLKSLLPEINSTKE